MIIYIRHCSCTCSNLASNKIKVIHSALYIAFLTCCSAFAKYSWKILCSLKRTIVIPTCDKQLSFIFHFILVSFLSFFPVSSPLRDWLRFHKKHDCCLLNLTHLTIVWWMWSFFFFLSFFYLYIYIKAISNQLLVPNTIRCKCMRKNKAKIILI